MLTDIVKLARVFLVMSAANAASERVRIGPRNGPRIHRRCRKNEHDRNC